MALDPSPFLTSGTPYLVAFATGVFGAAHCAGMCGPVAASIHLATRPTGAAAAGRQLAFNAGRILTYTALGAALGFAGMLAAEPLAEWRAWVVLRAIAALIMIAAGLYIAGWWPGLVWLERAGARVTRPLNRILPRPPRPDTPRNAFAFGLLWGGIPCGLVYTALVWSLAAGNALAGALFMLAFGLGTLPAVTAAGWSAARLAPALTRWPVRKLTGAFVAVAGVWILAFTAIVRPDFGIGCLPPS